MKYLIIGSGGVGGAIGGFLAASGEDVTFIARGTHLEKLKSCGLRLNSGIKGELTIFPVSVCEEDEFQGKADVIFVCVKGYSLDEVIPVIKRASHSNTLVIPVLNGIGTGDRIYQSLKEGFVLDGCIYIVSYISKPGVIVQSGRIFKVIFGTRKDQSVPIDKLNAVKASLCNAGIEAIISTNIESDTFIKFSFISPFACCGAFNDIKAKDMQQEGEYRQMFIDLVNEIKSLADSMGVEVGKDILFRNLKILDSLSPDDTASMQKDIKAGKNIEAEELLFKVVRLSEKYNINLPKYRVIADSFGYKYRVHGKIVAGKDPGSVEASYYECDNKECKKIFIRKN